MMKSDKTNVFVVCGPTASGKTSLSIDIAKKMNAEIVSADSMQIYKEMNIGTAKPTYEERCKVPHHMIDIVSVTEEYNVSRYVNEAGNCIDSILAKGKNVILVGGTGLYIDSLINNINFFEIENDLDYRNFLQDKADEFGGDYLLEMLKQVDYTSYCNLHKNDIKRIIRALEVYHVTGKPISQFQAKSKQERKYNVSFIGLNYSDRQILYNRINNRVDIMLEDGLVDEANDLLKLNISKTALSAIGYSDIFDYLSGRSTLDHSIDNIKLKTRRYAKRQLTWFRRNKEINWLYPDCYDSYENMLSEALTILS